MYLNAVPGLSAHAASSEEPVSGPSTYQPQWQDYLTSLNHYLEDIDSTLGAQSITAVKQLQTSISVTADCIVGADAASDPQNYSDISQSAISPSRGSRSRASLFRSNQDLDCLARTVHGEARGESFEGQVAVAAVVLNRVDSGKFGTTIPDVVFQRNAFTAVRDGQYYLQPNNTSYEAARAALNGWDPTDGAVYYWNPVTATSRWVRTRTIIKTIGHHVFAV